VSKLELVPFSSEWLVELEKLNPVQAAQTRAVIAASSGTEEICQICGDSPTKDYSLPGVPIRARLCDDCNAIQGNMRGR
jgi:hypothetical protein